MADSILILEDDGMRLAEFRKTAATLSSHFQVHCCGSVTAFVDCLATRDSIRLVSLDYDLKSRLNPEPNPGCGGDAADYLSKLEPFCPVILHTSDYQGRWGMHDRLIRAGWPVVVVEPVGAPDHWIPSSWLAKVRSLVQIE